MPKMNYPKLWTWDESHLDTTSYLDSKLMISKLCIVNIFLHFNGYIIDNFLYNRH